MVTGDEAGKPRRNDEPQHLAGHPGPLARFGRRIAAIVAECNYAQTRLTSLRNTPERF